MERKKFVVIDTETTGLFLFKDAGGNPVPADAPEQPRMASASLIFIDDISAPEDTWRIESHLIRPEGWTMAEYDARAIADGKKPASEVNGLTDEILNAYGVPVHDVLDLYSEAILSDYAVAAHNAQFDCKVFRAELRRAGRPDLFDKTPNVCTMRGMQPLMKIPARGGRGYKFPSLPEVCGFFDIPFEESHEAQNDALGAARVLKAMWDNDLMPEPRIHYAKKPPVYANK